MKVVILSRSRSIPSTRRLVEAARGRGHTVRVMNPAHVSVHFDRKGSRLRYRGKVLKAPDVVIPRIAASIASYGLPVVKQFSSHGAVTMNSAYAIGLARNPARCFQKLSANGIDIPSTVMARDAQELKAMVPLVGGVPVLVKLLAGTERRAVMLCETEQSLEAALEAVLGLGHNIVMQEYARKAGRDLRIFVVGGKALAAVSRVPRPGKASRTLQRFARLERCVLTEPVRRAAEATAQLLQLEVGAVDLLEAKAGSPKVFEVNPSPSLPDMEAATGVDLATAIIERAEALVAARNQTA
ncbi:MAG: RimK family alpha-L-glutamate ligase [Myxococcota bacterium]|jgi:ribosomal protein S6--L-glutamate ligase